MNFRILDPAEEEMLQAARSYEDQAIGLGERFLDEVEGCVDLLLDRPCNGCWRLRKGADIRRTAFVS